MTNISKLPLSEIEEAIKTGKEFYFICGYTDHIIKTSILKIFCNVSMDEFMIGYKNPNHGEYIKGTEKINFSQCCPVTECFQSEEAVQQYMKNDTRTI